MNEDKIKQVIVIRRDLKMRRGKEIAQGSHSSIAFLTRQIQNQYEEVSGAEVICPVTITKEEFSWIQSGFTKICVTVDSEEELLRIYLKAFKAGLTVHLITDSGLTEFNNVPTHTCLCIGPHYSSKIDPITKDLRLY